LGGLSRGREEERKRKREELLKKEREKRTDKISPVPRPQATPTTVPDFSLRKEDTDGGGAL
jgi:hypothetical protein